MSATIDVDPRCPMCQNRFRDGEEVLVLPVAYVRVDNNFASVNRESIVEYDQYSVVHRMCLEGGPQGR